jgi:hypothetical protein
MFFYTCPDSPIASEGEVPTIDANNVEVSQEV